MLVKDVMSTRVISASPEEPVSFVSRLLSRSNVGALPVCTSDGKLKGMVTDRDIVLRCVAAGSDPETTAVNEIMSRSVVTASPMDDLKKVSEIMSTAQIRRLPVVDNGKLVGIVSLGDLSRQPHCEMEAAKALSEISSNIRKR
ncbi:MAG: CBS domain-containing protein [Oscillospiraceae bacterium]|nr:CBS domain-containing protein [Oscillospiraceae bacterium]